MTDDPIAPVGWRYVPSDVWGSQVLTQDPKTAELAIQAGRDVEPLFTKAQMDAKVAAERERCAALCDALVDPTARYSEAEYSAGAAECARRIREGAP